jgi:tetratricopeptide (TPR) repeat protein
MTGNYDAAAEALAHVLDTRRKTLGERHPDTAVAFNQIGSLLLETGDYDQSKRNLSQGLYISKTSLGESHPQTATCMYDFARLCWRRGVLGDEAQLSESLALFEKAYNIRKKTLGEKHADTLQSANNQGIIMIGADKAAEAEIILTETLQKRKEIFGINHLGMAESCHALSLCYFKMGKTAEGKQALEEELKIKANVLGATNPLVEKTLLANKQILAMYP